MDPLNGPYIARWNYLDDQFQPFREMYKLITKFSWPSAGNYLETENSTELVLSAFEEMYDNSTELAIGTMAAGMMAGHMSPSLKWHRIATEDPDRNRYPAVKEWLDYVEEVMYGVYARSNLYEIAHRGFEEQSAFGTESIFIEEDFRNVARASLFTAGEYRIALGNNGIPDTLYRQTSLGAGVLVNMFGNKVSDRVKKAAENAPYQPFDIMHVVEPNDSRNANLKGPKDMPYRSIWMEKGEAEVRLREGGFEEKPFAITRMRVRGNWPYGLSPGMSTLGMTRVLNEMEKSGLVGIHRQTSPPLVGNDRFKGLLDLTPDAINWSSGSEDPFLRPLYQSVFSIDKLEYKQAEIRSRIAKNFYTDLFLMFAEAAASGRQVTATEVQEKAAERRLQLGPMVERQSHEKLDPIVDRIFNICMRRGLFPPIPEELDKQPLKIEYVGLLAQAQKLVELQGISTYLGMVERVANLDQNALIRPDFDKILQKTADITGISANLNRSDEEVKTIQGMQAEAQQREQALMRENAELENISKATEVDIEKLKEMQGG